MLLSSFLIISLTCTHIHIHAYTHTCIHTYMHTHIHAYTQMQMKMCSLHEEVLEVGDEVLSGDKGVVPGREDGEAVDRLTDEYQMAQHVVLPAHTHTCTYIHTYIHVHTDTTYTHIHNIQIPHTCTCTCEAAHFF